MATQNGLIKFRGDIGGITFYGRGGKDFARETRTVDPEKIRSSPNYERVRENNTEFTRAAKAAKLLLRAFRSVTVGATDTYVFSRLLRLTMLAIKADPISDRGQRTIVHGEPAFVEGFNFNSTGELTAVFKSSFKTVLNRAAGTIEIDIESFTPSRMVTAPEGATHFRLISAAAELNFETDDYSINTSTSVEIKIGNDHVATQALKLLVQPGSAQPWFVVLGIEFIQLVNGKYYNLKNGTFNSFSIIKADKPQ